MDAIANMMTTLVNAQRVKKERVAIPHSAFKERLARFLQEKNLIDAMRVQEGTKPKLILTLKYADGRGKVESVRRISKPGYRQYIGYQDLPYMAGRPGCYVLLRIR